MSRTFRTTLLVLALLTLTTGAAAAGNGGKPPGQQAPASTSPPTISGTPMQGQTLKASAGSWTGNALAYGYQWSRCDLTGNACAPIAGETGSSHVAAVADVGSTLRVTVTATNKNGTASATSAATGVVAPAPSTSTGGLAPTSTSPPVVSGTPTAGNTLSTTTGGWSGSSMSYAYAWVRCDSTGAACSAIAGATTATYLLTSSDVGATIRSQVTATNSYGTATATSSQTAPITAATTPPVAPSSSRFGIAAGGNLQNFSSSDLGHYLDGAVAAHAGWIRVDINWEVIQAGGPSSFNWAPFDAVVSAARSRGLNVLGGILYTPSWARAAGTTGTYPPTNLSDYATFVKTAVAHYAPMGVHTYEIWNEPNIVNFWAPGPDPARYTQMLKLAYQAAKAADPSAFVVSGGLSPYGAYGNADAQHMNPLNFLAAMYANGAATSLDAVGWHPYNYPYGLAYANWSAWSQMSQTTPSARSIMTSNGDGAKQIWSTEFGAPTGTSSQSMTETAQAQFVTDSYAQLKLSSWAGPAFLYSFRDAGTSLSSVEDNFGILHFDWSPKAADAAYQTAAAGG